MERTKFTIIIPVKDRSYYLYHTLRTCMAQEYDNMTVIVADDASSDDSVEMVHRLMKKDERIQLIAREQRVGMRENFEDALRRVTEGYVIALGGDDGLLPNALKKLAQFIEKNNAKLVTWCPPVYEYPSELKKYGQFSIYRKTTDRIIDSSVYLERQTRNFNYVADIETPMFYVKGTASIELINRVKSRTKDGYFYSCSTPDGYSGIVLSGEVEQFHFSGVPFSIYGVSPSSQGQVYKNNDKKSEEQSKEFFKFAENMGLHRELAGQPYSPLLSLMTVDYLLTARDLPGWPGKFPDIDYKAMISHAVNELALCSFGESRIQREVDILYAIAELHGLTDYLTELLKKTKRHGVTSLEIGNAVSRNMLYVSPKELGIENIYDASYAAQFLSKSKSLISFRFLKSLIVSTWKIYSSMKKVNGSLSQYSK